MLTFAAKLPDFTTHYLLKQMVQNRETKAWNPYQADKKRNYSLTDLNHNTDFLSLLKNKSPLNPGVPWLVKKDEEVIP